MCVLVAAFVAFTDKYQTIWGRIKFLFSRELIVATNEPYVVYVMKGREIVAQLPCKIPVCVPFLELVDISNVP